MPKFIKAAVAAALIAMPAMGLAQVCQSPLMAHKIKNEALNRSQIDSLTSYMTDLMGPRLESSRLKLRAERLMMDKLRAMGFDNVRAEYAWKFNKGGWDNERTYVAMTQPYYCAFFANPKAWSGSTKGQVRAQCVLLQAADTADLAKYRGKLSDKILIRPISRTYKPDYEPLAERYDQDDLDAMAMDTRLERYRGYKRDAAAGLLRKAIDSLIRTERPIAVIEGRGNYNIPPSTYVRYDVGDAEPVPEIILPVEAHGRMARLLAAGHPVEMELDVRNTFTPNQDVNNIIAEIPGTDPKLKNEIVMLGGHLDSWHGGTGASDNATGAMVMIEAMRVLKQIGAKPRRTIRLALWGGEEVGHYGSHGYADKYLRDPKTKKNLPGYEQFALYLNSDFGTGLFRGIFLEENDMARPFFETWMKPLAPLGFTAIAPGIVKQTDHETFSEIGLPAFHFMQEPIDYYRFYHTPMDTYEHMELDDLRKNAAIVAWLAYCAAQDPARIPPKPTL